MKLTKLDSRALLSAFNTLNSESQKELIKEILSISELPYTVEFSHDEDEEDSNYCEFDIRCGKMTCEFGIESPLTIAELVTRLLTNESYTSIELPCNEQHDPDVSSLSITRNGNTVNFGQHEIHFGTTIQTKVPFEACKQALEEWRSWIIGIPYRPNTIFGEHGHSSFEGNILTITWTERIFYSEETITVSGLMVSKHKHKDETRSISWNIIPNNDVDKWEAFLYDGDIELQMICVDPRDEIQFVMNRVTTRTGDARIEILESVTKNNDGEYVGTRGFNFPLAVFTRGISMIVNAIISVKRQREGFGPGLPSPIKK